MNGFCGAMKMQEIITTPEIKSVLFSCVGTGPAQRTSEETGGF